MDKKEINLNFSVYVENKQKNKNNLITLENNFLENHILNIYPKFNNEWIDSNLVSKCQICSIVFSWYYRKHHCRACGGVFCYYCCNNYITIPQNILDIPKESDLWRITAKKFIIKVSGNFDYSKSLVCNDCNNKILKLNDVQHLIKICEYLDICDLYNIIRTNKKWFSAGIHYLSMYRNIQYKSVDYIFTKWECNILSLMSDKIIGHSNWFILLIKTSLINKAIYNKNNIPYIIELISKFNNNKIKDCWNLMCSRKCSLEIDFIDLFEIIQYISYLPNYSSFFWDNDENKILIFELSKLIIHNNNNKNLKSKLFEFNLNLDKSLSIPYFINVLDILIKNINYTSKPIYDYIIKLLDLFCNSDENLLILLSLEYNYQKSLSNNITLILNSYLNSKLEGNLKSIILKTINTFTQIYNYKSTIEYTNLLPIIYPFDTRYLITKIIKIIELSSSSKPLLIDIIIQKILSNNKLGELINKKIILKKDNNLRKENIVSSLIILLQNKLINQSNRERIEFFEPIPTYKILMISNNLGVIEYLENSLTLKNISLKNYTLQNYILENNKDSKIKTIKERFAKSLAISSCLSYVLGLGDRHANNIMISNNGHIIHIDYGYILENPIHFNIVNNPIIRISYEMIDFLGGWNSEYFLIFKNYIAKVFDIIRLYSNIIINFYNILGYEKIIDWDSLKKKLVDRFMNGLSFKDVEVVLLDVIESSTNSYSGVFLDMCNEYGQKLKNLI